MLHVVSRVLMGVHNLSRQMCPRAMSTGAGRNLYEVLGIKSDASDQQIKSAYYQLSKKYHPDTNSGGCSSKFQELTAAYEVLKSDHSRKEHDRKFRPSRAKPSHGYRQHTSYEYYGSHEEEPKRGFGADDDFDWFDQQQNTGQYSSNSASPQHSTFYWNYYYDTSNKSRKKRSNISDQKKKKRDERNNIKKLYRDPNQFKWWPKLFRIILSEGTDDFDDASFDFDELSAEEMKILSIMLNSWVRDERKRRKRRSKKNNTRTFRGRVMSEEEYERFMRDVLF